METYPFYFLQKYFYSVIYYNSEIKYYIYLRRKNIMEPKVIIEKSFYDRFEQMRNDKGLIPFF